MSSPQPADSRASSTPEIQPVTSEAKPVDTQAESPRASAPSPTAPVQERRAGGASRLILWALVVALVVSLGFLVDARQHASQLATTVDGLTAELAVANQAIEAHEQRLGEVRTRVADLMAGLGALQTLVGGEPTEVLATPESAFVSPAAPEAIEPAVEAAPVLEAEDAIVAPEATEPAQIDPSYGTEEPLYHAPTHESVFF